MPFTRTAQVVGPGARAAAQARRWVTATLSEISRPDLHECAELAISELVGNAFLHGSDPISIRLRGDHSGPLIEVFDGSGDHPHLEPGAERTALEPRVTDASPETGEFECDEDDLLAQAGRGLSLVAQAAQTWGVQLTDTGKVVWFVPSADLSETPIAPQLSDTRHR